MRVLRVILKANSEGTITIIHAHGDNISLLKKYVPRFQGSVLGSVQTEPFDNLVNYGGFTDGDRCIFLALNFKCKRIILSGFDFGLKVGKYSKMGLNDHDASPRKIIKLEFAQFLISEILKKYPIEIFTLSTNQPINGLKSITIKEVEEICKK